jgi:hypothetical protein
MQLDYMLTVINADLEGWRIPHFLKTQSELSADAISGFILLDKSAAAYDEYGNCRRQPMMASPRSVPLSGLDFSRQSSTAIGRLP